MCSCTESTGPSRAPVSYMAKFLTACTLRTAMCMTSFYPPFSEGSKISNSLRASNLTWLPPTVHSNCSERLWLGCPGEPPWLARRIKSKQLGTCLTYASSFSLFCLCLRQNTNTMLSLQLPMKFDNIVRVEPSRYLTKITILRRKAGSCSQAFGFTTITMYSWWQPSEIGCA